MGGGGVTGGSYGRRSKKLSESLQGMEPRPSDLCSHALPLSFRELDVDPEHSSPKFDKHPTHSIPHTVSVFIFGFGATPTQTKSTLVLCVLTKPGEWILYFENLTDINYDFYPF